MFGVEFMTDKERKATIKKINDTSEACKVDQDEVMRAITEFGVDCNLAVHINMMKCEALIEMQKPIQPLTAEDYAEICKFHTEEERRGKLVEVLTIKNKEQIKAVFKENKEMYDLAVSYVSSGQRTSIGRIQSGLKVSYNVASAIMDQLESDGIVSKPDCRGRREVLTFKKDNPNLGKVLKQKTDDAEPVMEPVAQKDAEVGGIAADRLRSLIERIERLQEEAKGIAADIRDVFAEAKSAGFDVKIMRECIKQRKMRAADRDEREFLIDTYKKALDM